MAFTGLPVDAATRHIDMCLSEKFIADEPPPPPPVPFHPPPPQVVPNQDLPDFGFFDLAEVQPDDFFSIKCPYAGCTAPRMQMGQFPAHAIALHAHLSQQVACPICSLLGEDGYQVSQNTNLLGHLQATHSDLCGTAIPRRPPAPATHPPAPMFPAPFAGPGPFTGVPPVLANPLFAPLPAPPPPSAPVHTLPAFNSFPNNRFDQRRSLPVDLDADDRLAFSSDSSSSDDDDEDEDRVFDRYRRNREPLAEMLAHSTSPQRNAPISPKVLPTLNIAHYHEYEVTEVKTVMECVICQDEIQNGETAARLQCLCVYHKACIDRWLSRKSSCPSHPTD